ncbi:MAG: helix-turn-helix transcriptional regulator [Bauldia sp.]
MRNRQQAYNLLVREFKRSGLTQIQLAARTGMAPEVISRLLKAPRNIELDTLSKLMFAINGAALAFATAYPKA